MEQRPFLRHDTANCSAAEVPQGISESSKFDVTMNMDLASAKPSVVEPATALAPESVKGTVILGKMPSLSENSAMNSAFAFARPLERSRIPSGVERERPEASHSFWASPLSLPFLPRPLPFGAPCAYQQLE